MEKSHILILGVVSEEQITLDCQFCQFAFRVSVAIFPAREITRKIAVKK
jgi:hypothetical protein